MISGVLNGRLSGVPSVDAVLASSRRARRGCAPAASL